MAAPGQLVLHQRFCANGDCRVLFHVCSHCDRGQRYCCKHCRTVGRLRQRRRANCRYQQSVEGRLDHSDRQRRYRARCKQKSVTDQGSISIPSPVIIALEEKQAPVTPARSNQAPAESASAAGRCIVCGRSSRFVDPFPHIPRSGW